MPVTSAGSATILPFVAPKTLRIVMRTIPRKALGSDIFASHSGKPGVLLQVHDGRFVYGYRHCMYLLQDDTFNPYSAAELRQLETFVKAQDRLRGESRDTIVFRKVLARIAKIGKKSPERKAGYRWRYSAGEGTEFRMYCFGSLKMMLVALNNLP